MADNKKQKSSFFVIMTLLLAVIVLPISYFILAGLGEKSGVEFSPDDFSMRRFDYNRVPFFNWTKRGIDYDPYPCPTAKTLIADDWIRVTGRTPRRWHLVSESRMFSSEPLPAECDARFLTDYFEMSNSEGEIIVLKWTDSNPKSAKILWPLIAELARNQVYLPIPGILEFSLAHKKADNDSVFLKSLENRVATAWTDAARICQTNNNHVVAIKLFDKAIEIGGENEYLIAEKAKSESLLDDGELP